MLTIHYDKHGICVADENIEWLYHNHLKPTALRNDHRTYRLGTMLALDRVRQGIAEEEIPCHAVTFVINGKDIQVDEYGAWPNHPEGVNPAAKITRRILRAARLKKRREQ
jgi:hypothetical protein